MSEDRGSGVRSWLDRLILAVVGEPRDRDQLVEVLRDAEQRSLLDAEALSMIEGALQVGDMQVRDIMVPRAEMAVVEDDKQPEEFVDSVIATGHSRFPVIGDNRDEVAGIMLAKDLIGYFAQRRRKRPHFNMRDVMRPAVFIPESKRLNVLLREFKASRNHMAIVVDEYGGVAGLVTIEDVIEQIVGDIDDEHDVEGSRYIHALRGGQFTVKARTPVDEFNEHFGTGFSDEEFDTIGGLVVKGLGHLPQRGETTVIDGVRFCVLRADKRRVHLLRVETVRPADKTGDDTDDVTG